MIPIIDDIRLVSYETNNETKRSIYIHTDASRHLCILVSFLLLYMQDETMRLNHKSSFIFNDEFDDQISLIGETSKEVHDE